MQTYFLATAGATVFLGRSRAPDLARREIARLSGRQADLVLVDLGPVGFEPGAFLSEIARSIEGGDGAPGLTEPLRALGVRHVLACDADRAVATYRRVVWRHAVRQHTRKMVRPVRKILRRSSWVTAARST